VQPDAVHIPDISTPAVLVDAAKLERNVSSMQAAANAAGLRLRPHAKTHKSPHIARIQLERGAVGICCAKLGEAEVFADAGITDIRLPYPLNPVNADRVFALAERIQLSFIVDDPAVAQAWSDLAERRGRALEILIKVDVGFHRCGIDPHAPSAPGTACTANLATLPRTSSMLKPSVTSPARSSRLARRSATS